MVALLPALPQCLASMQPPRLATVAKIAAAAIAVRILYRAGKLVYNVLTSVPPAAEVQHNCIPPPDFKADASTGQATRAYIQSHYPELMDIVDRGNMLVLQPARMLQEALEHAAQQQQPSSGAFLAANSAAASEGSSPDLSPEDVDELLRSPALQECLANPVPELLVFVGTVHVAKQSGEEVTRVMKAVQPSRVALELCQGRMQALLMNPFADPVHDLEPCPVKKAELAAAKNTSLTQILEAVLRSRDHNVLMAALSGMYSRLEVQLKVTMGEEFLAARRAMIEQLQQQQQAAGDQQPAQVDTWLRRTMPADRSVMDTLMGLWGALRPWQRLRLLWDVGCMLLSELDEKLLASLANEDLVDSLLKDLQEDFPELLRPLLHDRNFVLAANTWTLAQHADGGPVVAVVGKGHLPGIVYVVQQLVNWAAKTGGHPIRVMGHQETVSVEDAAASRACKRQRV